MGEVVAVVEQAAADAVEQLPVTFVKAAIGLLSRMPTAGVSAAAAHQPVALVVSLPSNKLEY